MTRVGKKPSPEYNVTTQLLNSTPPSFCTIKKFIKKKGPFLFCASGKFKSHQPLFMFGNTLQPYPLTITNLQARFLSLLIKHS